MKMEGIEKLLPSRFQRFIMGRDILRPPLSMTPYRSNEFFTVSFLHRTVHAKCEIFKNRFHQIIDVVATHTDYYF